MRAESAVVDCLSIAGMDAPSNQGLNMKTYADIKAEIAKLERRAEAALKDEVTGVIDRIKEAIKAYGLTAEDLGFGSRKKAAAKHKPSTKRGAAPRTAAANARTSVGVPKYRDPETGSTWTGRGRPPEWIAAAKNRDAFLIPVGGDGVATRPAGAATRSGRRMAPGGKRRNEAGAGAKKRRERKTQSTPAVQIESGAATE